MIGMLVGVAALSAWGLYRFQQILQTKPKSKSRNPLDIANQIATNYREAYAMEYGEIFTVTAIVCVVGAVLGLFIAGREQHADEGAEPETRPGSLASHH